MAGNSTLVVEFEGVIEDVSLYIDSDKEVLLYGKDLIETAEVMCTVLQKYDNKAFCSHTDGTHES